MHSSWVRRPDVELKRGFGVRSFNGKKSCATIRVSVRFLRYAISSTDPVLHWTVAVSVSAQRHLTPVQQLLCNVDYAAFQPGNGSQKARF